jgi:hypothetical protein
MKTANRVQIFFRKRPVVAILVAVGLFAASFALAQGIVRTVQVVYTPQGANPVAPGSAGSYHSTVDNFLHSVSTAGVDKTTVDTLQTAYTNGSDITLAAGPEGIALTCYVGQTTPALPITRNAIGSGTYDAIKLENTTAAVSSILPQNSPAILLAGSGFRTEAPLGNQPDQWKIQSNPNFDQTGDTAHLEMLHSYDGTNFLDGFRVTLQDQFGDGEVIMETVSAGSWCVYPHSAPGDPHGLQAFYCINNNQIKMGLALASTQRISWSTTLGFSPTMDNVVDLGSLDSGTFRWKQVNAVLVRGDATTFGVEQPAANVVGVWASNFDTAALNAQQYSASIKIQGSGWDTNANTYRSSDWYMQARPVQQVAAAPTVNLSFFSAIAGVSAVRERATLRSGKADDTDGGEFVTGHFCGMGATPTFAAGSAANCSGAASVSIVGTDTAGEITLTTGSGSCSAGTVLTITLANAFYSGTTPFVTLMAGNAATASNNGTVYIDRTLGTAATWVIAVGSPGLTASTTYKAIYHTFGN